MKRRFEATEDGASKFWEVSVDGNVMTVRFGKIGTDGQTKPKDLGSPDAAAREAAKLVAEKTKKGYVEVGAAAPAPAPVAVTAPAPTPAPPAPTGPMFGSVYSDGAQRTVTWGASTERLRRCITPEHDTTIAALVRGWRIPFTTREEADAFFARVLALPAEAPREPAAMLAHPFWDGPKWIVFGAVLAARTSDYGTENRFAMAKGIGAAPPPVIDARIAWADAWLPDAFASFPEAAGAPKTFFATGGAMGDAWLVLGTPGGKIKGLPFAKRIADGLGKKYDGLGGIELAHASWDEDTCVEVDLSAAALAPTLATVGAVVPKPLVMLAPSYDSRS